jgi:glycosyltransferase involved in cell wall biosynthesis
MKRDRAATIARGALLDGRVHVCHLIHSLGVGGAEQVLVDLARVSAETDMTLSVVSLVEPEDRTNWWQLERHGVAVHGLGLSSRWDPRAFPRAVAAVRHVAPDVLHTHLKHADLVGAVVARALRLPWVSTLHVIEETVSPVGAAKRWLAGQARRRAADRTVAVSEAQRRWFLERFPVDPGQVVTIPNGVVPAPVLSAGERATLRASIGVPPGAVVAANVAIMRPGKGHDDLLAALSRLPEDDALVVVLAGDGPERRRLEGIVADDDRLRRRVRFLGYRDDVPELLQAVDLVVHPSHADALPTALIHALGAGVPVVATEVGGIPEVVGEQAGVLLPPRDPARLASALRCLAQDPRARAAMGVAGRRRFDERFHARRWAESLDALYAAVVEERSSRRTRRSAR